LADTVPLRQTAPARTRAFGLGVAILTHVLILAGLVAAVRIPLVPDSPAIQVSLVPPFRLTPAPPPKAAPPERVEPREIQPRVAKIVGPERVRPLPIPAAPPDAAARARLLSAPFAAKPHEAVSQGLRTTVGCTDGDFLKLSPAEQEACRKRNHILGADAPTYAVGPSDHRKRAWLDKQAAKVDAHRRDLEGPPTPGMTGCPPDSRFGNLGFSCPPAGSNAHVKF
jgi:hypothetical protein